MPRRTNVYELKQLLTVVNKAEIECWESDVWKLQQISDNKNKIITDYIGVNCNDEDYDKFLEYLKKDINAGRVFDKLIDYPLNADLIVDNIDVLRKAFINKDKEALRKADKLCNEHLDEIKYRHIVYINNGDEEEHTMVPGIEDCAYRKEQKRHNNSKKHLDSLKAKIYDEKMSDYMTINWGSPDVTKDEYMATAGIIYDRTIEVWNHNYSYNKCLKEWALINKKKKALVRDRDFRGYVKETLTKGVEYFEKEKFIEGFEQYKKELTAAREALQSDHTFMFGKYESIEQMNNRDYRDGDIEEYTSLETMSKADIKSKAGKLIDDTIASGKVFRQADIKQACDYVIANVFKSPNFDETLLDGVIGGRDYGIEVDNMNKKVFEMRKEIIKDPVFQEVLSRRVDRRSFYSVYKAAVNKEVNRKINEEKKRSKEYKENYVSYNAHKNYMKSHSIKLDEKTSEFIDNMHDEIMKINGTKSPSKYMRRLLNAFDDVIGKDGVVSLEAMDELNRAALSYYSERQGVIFSPLTDKGKARLSNVEKLVRVTSRIMDREREIENNISLRKQSVSSVNKAPVM